MKFFFQIIFIMCLASSSFAQIHPILDEFKVSEADSKVYISCIVSSGKTCKGINVLRSEDSINFVSIARIDGTCGNASSPIRYSFIDENPIKNKRTFYALQLGGFANTNVLSIYIIDTKQEGFVVSPNPAKGRTQIFIENKHQKTIHFSLLNYNGKEVMTKVTTSNMFELELSSLQSGMYPFIIFNESDNNKAFGKLVIQN
jgi:hypothetical protein